MSLAPAAILRLRHFGRDRVGILDGDVRPGLRKLDRLFALFFRRDENIGGFVAIGIGQAW